MAGVLTDAPRGAIKATLNGTEHTFCLTMGAIERFEDAHPIGIYQFLGKLGEGKMTYTQARDLLCVALVGGGMTDKEAAAIAATWCGSTMFDLPGIASKILTAALFPDAGDEIDLESEKGKLGKA